MTPVISCLGEGLYNIRFGERNVDSFVAAKLPEIELDDASVRYENGKVNAYKEDIPLVSIIEPAFDKYNVCRQSGGETLVRKTVDGIKTTTLGGENTVIRESYHASLEFIFNGDTLFGLGSHEEGYPCLNGHVFYMIQENMRISVPVFVSDKGYAVFIDNASYMSFDFREKNKCRLYIDSADCVDIYLIKGTLASIYDNLRLLTGVTPMLPKYALGYIQSKERYVNQRELIDTVREYRKREVPLDVIVQDWFYWCDNMWGEKVLDEKRYPDLTGCIKEIHDENAHIMISIWPNMSGGGINQNEFLNAGLMLADKSVYNAFSEKARDMYWKQARDGLFKHGIDAWWCDSSEPYDANWEGENRRSIEESVSRSVSEFKKYIDDSMINAYSFYHAKGIYEHQRQESPKRVLNLTRSGFAGQHRFATVAWSGDIAASWETLKKQVYIMQNYISTGEAYWNSDIGAFFVKNGAPWFWAGEFNDGVNSEEYRELYVRWLQFAGFTPMMRSHGTDTPREIWQFGEPGDKYYDAIKSAIELRYRLMPYFYSLMARTTMTGEMPIKPMALAFSEDEGAAECFDQYVYGNEMIVVPVTAYKAEKADVYLPAGVWYDFFTGEKYSGGKRIDINLDITHIPVFVKAGSIIPTAPVMQYADEIKDAEYDILIYAGADGAFSLYNDAGDGYDYENGEYSLTEILYNDKDSSVNMTERGKEIYAHKCKVHITR